MVLVSRVNTADTLARRVGLHHLTTWTGASSSEYSTILVPTQNTHIHQKGEPVSGDCRDRETFNLHKDAINQQ